MLRSGMKRTIKRAIPAAEVRKTPPNQRQE